MHIAMILTFGLGVICLILSGRQFLGKGVVLNNDYLYKSKEDRKRMTQEEKRPLYRQSAICFMLIGVACMLLGIDVLLSSTWLMYLYYALMVGVVVYAIISSFHK